MTERQFADSDNADSDNIERTLLLSFLALFLIGAGLGLMVLG
jgi:hypothetical protein